MDDLNDLIWQSGPTKHGGGARDTAKAAPSVHANGTASNGGGDDLLDLASPTLPKPPSQKLHDLDPLQADDASAVPRPSVASMRNLWEQMGNNGNNSNGHKHPAPTKQPRSSSPLPAPAAAAASGHDPFGDLLGLGGAPQLGRASSPAPEKKAPSLNDLSRTGSPANTSSKSKPATPTPNAAKESVQQPQKPPRGHRAREGSGAGSHSAGSPPISTASHRSPVISATVVATEEDDNPLGILAEPVTSKKAPPPPPPSVKPKPSRSSPGSMPASEIVEMGFSTEQARTALTMAKGDVETAVGILVQDREAAQQLSGEQGSGARPPASRPTRPARPASLSRTSSGHKAGPASDDEPRPATTATAASINSERLWTAAEEIKQSVFSKASSLFQQSRTLLQERMDAYQQSAHTSRPLNSSRHGTRLSLEGDESEDDDKDGVDDRAEQAGPFEHGATAIFPSLSRRATCRSKGV
ncbi:hypothetical protein SYNPS1DRAFT_30506 [Syncephalis pseudoplumigaleata]|uniref:UBA domain-containing protein n=1 Tax=Syncephalis pseudoplumigaleata TaxID=1712513 RepID=A0A4P9YVB5_9FUNG|nr:hypothetical protein SYNPS1DRAFT_30506 [Syncephalis pseudoplumigaleata]|eukprot:RKP23738.1 hypothetical protein SYNPS1DRAFT_30506 [Syncephalis pseudoplumigaleata]